ncbi:hypothetical protein STAS_23284 [Striga asiatica]|uniref:Uncharacterized protein n=1 Tax=Striga asiatica TaxID=4170 RepID=A0A5A7QM17_STRAF|nr:hypothetical protein STAS_23284 [Striga asiatica]
MGRLVGLSNTGPSPSPIRTHPSPPSSTNLFSPLGSLDGLDRGDFCEAAYEVFFTACRSTPGFGGRTAISYYSDGDATGPGTVKAPGVGMAVTSRVKRALGLKMMRRSPSSRRASSCGSNPLSPGGSGSSPRSSPRLGPRLRRPMTSAEIMRQQMRVTEESDNRLRKTLMRTLVGQLLRHLKPSEFSDPHEYHLWQRRQLKILEAGLLLYPSTSLDPSDTFAPNLRAIIQASELHPIDTSKNSPTMRSLCTCVVSLACRSSPTDGYPHWADGYPLNMHLYTGLLSAIFDLKDETLVLDEVDELFELMKKTWSTLGVTRPLHNLCLMWVFFEQYVGTGQVEPDLLGASFNMLTEVANDAKRADRDPVYLRMLAGVMGSLTRWCERRLFSYHDNFGRGTLGVMESILPLLFSAAKILEEDVPSYVLQRDARDESAGNRVDYYVRSSLRNAFAKMLEDQNVNGTKYTEAHEVSELLIKLAKKTEELALKEKDIFSPVLKKWHPVAAGVAAVTLHTCFGTLLKQYLTEKSTSLNETILVLQRAGKLEKFLVQLVVEDSVDCEDGGKTIVREMVPYEVDSFILRLLKQWVQERLQKGKEYVLRAKQTETWNPKSKSEPYANSAVELAGFAKEAVDDFFEIPVNLSENLFFDFVQGVENLFQDYIAFVSSCGTKQSYLPTLPSLCRCSRDSKLSKLFRTACSVGVSNPIIEQASSLSNNNNNPRPSTSRGTQRLYIRLNTIHYLTSQLNSLAKALSLSPKAPPTPARFELSLLSLQDASRHVAEVSAYRLVFLDSNSVFYGGLYAGHVARARVRPALRLLKQNLTLLCAIVAERVQPLALKEVMRASFEAFLLVLLAGGSSRVFGRADHAAIEEDLESLKRMFCTCGEGLLVEDMVDKESETVEDVVGMMGQASEQLIEELMSRMGVGGGSGVPLPPTTGKWGRSDPNTILRVLCYRDDPTANLFLKKVFRLARRPRIRMI